MPGDWEGRGDVHIYDVGATTGVFDLFHVGHLNVLMRAKQRCRFLIVGVCSDDAIEKVKGHRPVVPLEDRLQVVKHIDVVDLAVPYDYDRLELYRRRPFEVFFKGDDWLVSDAGNRLVEEMAQVGVPVEFFPYTPTTSSTHLREALASMLR